MVTNQSAPSASVVPVLIYEDVGRAIEWLCRAFGFTERLRHERDGVIGHAQLQVAEGALIQVRFQVEGYAYAERALKPKLDTLPPKDVHGPADKRYGQRALLVLAPDGNVLAFGQAISPPTTQVH